MSQVLVIPCFQCQDHLKKLLEDLELLDLSLFQKVWVVDNQSLDQTYLFAQETARKWQNPVPLIVTQNPQNLGLGGSFQFVFESLRQENIEWLFFLHGDGQAKAYNLAKWILAFRESRFSGLDFVWGDRFSKASLRVNYSFFRLIGNLVLSRIYSWITGVEISDLGSGLNAFRIKSFSVSEISKLKTDIAFDARLLLAAIRSEKKFQLMPIDWHQEGQVSTINSFKVGLDLLSILWKWKFFRE